MIMSKMREKKAHKAAYKRGMFLAIQYYQTFSYQNVGKTGI
jgi:hypothetical protein